MSQATTATVPEGTSAATSTPYRWRWMALAVVLIAEIMDLLDSTVVGIAAPSIRADLGGDLSMIQWIAAGYTLAFAVGLITGGRLGDIYGRRRMFLLGAIGFTVTSALCGLAVSPEMLITSRVLQGLFGAVLIPQGFGIIKSVFPPKELQSAFGAFGPAMGLSAVGGPILAGALISWDLFDAGWRTIFLINVPVGLLCILGALRFLPESRSADAKRLDLVGMLLVALATVLVIYPLVQGREAGWPAWTYVCLVASVPVFLLFGIYQARASRTGRAPLVEPALFQIRAFSGGLLVGLIFFAGMAGLMLTLGLYLQLGLGYTPLQAGYTQAPLALGVAVGAGLSATVLGRRYGRTVLQAGALVMAAGAVGLIVTLNIAAAPVSGWQLAPAMLLSGVGMGLLIAPFFDIVLAGVTLPMVGSASGVLNANQQLGSSAGIAVLGTIFFQLVGTTDFTSAKFTSATFTSATFTSATFTSAIQAVLWIVAALLVVSGLVAFLLPRFARHGD